MDRRITIRVLLFTIAAGVVLVDQVTKLLAVQLLEGEPRIAVLGRLAGFDFMRNPGAALGMGAGATWLFAVIAIVVLAGILLSLRKLDSSAWAVGLGLLLGGLLGNLADRLFRAPGFLHGAVVDFIDLYFFVCNVADIAITGAAATIIVSSLRGIPFTRTATGRDEAAEVDRI